MIQKSLAAIAVAVLILGCNREGQSPATTGSGEQLSSAASPARPVSPPAAAAGSAAPGQCPGPAPATPCGAGGCPEPRVSLEVSTASAAPGTEVTIEVMLHAGGVEVAGIQNDLTFDRATAITSCRVNPDIDKKASGFALHPRGCKVGEDCERLRALIVSLDNSKPIADGAVLYQCVVKIAADAAPRSYALTTSAVFASDPTGAAPAAKGVDGKVVVESKG